jgi:hypothetical protein
MAASTSPPCPARPSSASLPSSRSQVLAALALLAAALLLIGTDWVRREAAIARCERAGLAFDRAAGRCEEEPIAVAFLAIAFVEPEPSECPPHPRPLLRAP